MASILAGSTWMPRSLTTCPRNWTSRSQNSHLEKLAYSFSCRSNPKMHRRCFSWSTWLRE
ncbi:hypothetical protein HanIR_Chr16g0819071 [Helianthus annuus]|nr:hypothetical protein HanIR_Chr16g0819071 [Helianthus annuus]